MVDGVHSSGFGRVRAMLYLYTAKSGGSLSLALALLGSRKRSGDERLVLKSALLQGNEEVPQHPPLYYQERSSRVNLASSLSLLSPHLPTRRDKRRREQWIARGNQQT